MRLPFRACCAGCGWTIAVSVAPGECPACHGSVWDYRPPGEPARKDGEAAAVSFAEVASRVIGSHSVRRWRFEQLERAGYSTADALVLSGRSEVDLHQAVRLLQNRCAPPTAMRILI